MRIPRKPANPFPAVAGAITSLRVSKETVEALEAISERLTEWILAHPSREVRKTALTMTTDRILRTVLATFARDYDIALTPQAEE